MRREQDGPLSLSMCRTITNVGEAVDIRRALSQSVFHHCSPTVTVAQSRISTKINHLLFFVMATSEPSLLQKLQQKIALKEQLEKDIKRLTDLLLGPGGSVALFEI